MVEKYKRSELLSKKIRPIDLEKIKSISDLIDAYKETSIQARNLGACEEIFVNMLTDKERPTIILGLAGPLIAAGLRKVICDMIKYNLVDVIVSTGAILYQDIYQARGYNHYTGSPDMDDTELRDLYIDRIYDTLVDEEKFEETDKVISELVERLEPRGYSTRELLKFFGENFKDDNSILYNAAKYGLPVFSPALNDSSIGIGLTIYYYKHRNDKKMYIDPIRDNYELTQIILKSPCTGAIYIGGGVPKNWINDSEVMAAYIFDPKITGHKYAFQITMATPLDGGLSGSTLKEAQSWGKISKRAHKATVYIEASVALPLIVGSIIQKNVVKNRKRAIFDWENDVLKSLKI